MSGIKGVSTLRRFELRKVSAVRISNLLATFYRGCSRLICTILYNGPSFVCELPYDSNYASFINSSRINTDILCFDFNYCCYESISEVSMRVVQME